ncbi:class F sortase [Jiangella asiatica]|uniref:Class F sortase n=1 Tax=Jiangella asiatica TaxID=2530372 RepID=A0A4R5DGE5_9ACTN|nr:class F sortase [Jiangella asiatica]TDE13056.1 class F sortase [Jiangella asiatica]
MRSGPDRSDRRGVLLAAAATALLATLGAILLVIGLGITSSDAPITTDESAAAGVTPPTPSSSPANPADNKGTNHPTTGNQNSRANAPRPQFLPGSPPVSLDIPAIAVRSTTIVGLGLQDDGSIEVPRDANQPGWYTPGPSPGQLGPAIIAGHVDSDTGPAIFYRLGELRRGDRVHVTRADGTAATFVIDRVTTYDKDEFPTRSVYGATNRAELRLITCGGDYDEETGYDSNLVAFAHLV